MSIRKLNDYRDISSYDESIKNNIDLTALSKISIVNGAPNWNGTTWPGGSSGSYSSNLMVEYTVPSTCQEFTLTGLDSNAWGGMVIELILARPNTNQIGIDMYINADETYSRYAFKLITFGTSSGSPSVYGSSGAFGSAQIYTDGSPGGASGTTCGCKIDLMHNGDTVGWTSTQFLSPVGYYQQMEGKYVNSSTISNITSLKFKSYAVSSIGAGTIVRVYSKKINSVPLTNAAAGLRYSTTLSADSTTLTVAGLNIPSGGTFSFDASILLPASTVPNTILEFNNITASSATKLQSVSGSVSSGNASTLQNTGGTGSEYGAISGGDASGRVYIKGNVCNVNGYIQATGENCRTYNNGHALFWSMFTTNSYGNISQITLRASQGVFVAGSTLTVVVGVPSIVDATSQIVDLTGRSTDYALLVGQTATLTYTNATSVPLHVATVAGMYEIFVTGYNINPTASSAVTLKPNNTDYSNAFTWAQGSFDGGGSSGASATMSSIQVGQGSIINANWLAFTATTGKSMRGTTTCKDLSYLRGISQATLWNDTTTPWTSLGTIVFPFAQSGKIFIKRIA